MNIKRLPRIPAFSFWIGILLSPFCHKIFAQEILVNEYFNTGTQNGEWTELVVVKDNLNLQGWYIGDNNTDTDSWQPKVKFTNNPLWNNLRAGTIIQLDHASGTDDSNCNDAYDYDKSDGFIRICVRNTDYFEGGSTNTLFIASGGDFIHVVDKTGKMVHGLGHNENPGGSVTGSNCKTTSDNWTDITGANANTPPCPTVPFTFWEIDINDPACVKMKAGNLAGFASGILGPEPNAFVDTSRIASSGIGNGDENDAFIIDLRSPDFTAQTICAVKSANGNYSLSWQGMSITNDPLPADQTCGYMVVRNTTGDFGNPPQGKEFAAGDSYGTGPQSVAVVAILDHTGPGTVTFTENPGNGTFYYRAFPFRYKNTANFEHPTRGRTYNIEQYVKVNSQPAPSVTLRSDTVCQKDSAAVLEVLDSIPGSGKVVWYQSEFGNDSIGSGKIFRIKIDSTSTYWAGFPYATWCNGVRSPAKAVFQPLNCTYSSPDSVCEGIPALVAGVKSINNKYNWKILQTPAGLTVENIDSVSFRVVTNATKRKDWLYFELQCENKGGCKSKSKLDSIFTLPFECSLFSEPSVASTGKSMLVSVRSDRFPWQAENWQVKNGEILEQSPVSARVTSPGANPEIEAEIRISDQTGKPLCKAIRKLRPGLPNLLISKGESENQRLNFGDRKVNYLKIYNRWGQVTADFNAGYNNSWPSDNDISGTYFFEAGLADSDAPVVGWIEVSGK